MPRFYLCDIPVDPVTLPELLDKTMVWAGERDRGRMVCYLNAHVHNLARKNHDLRAILEQADVVYADGVSIVWGCRRKGLSLPERLTAGDFLPTLLCQCVQSQRKVFLLGGHTGIARQAAETLAELVPGWSAVGTAPGFFDTPTEPEIVAQIREAQPDILLVGMGTPRQEAWIVANRDRLQVPIIWAVGAAFDFFAGVEPRCPAWMGLAGLEWLFRLGANPRDKWRRYLVGNTKFIWTVFCGTGFSGVADPTKSTN